MSKTTIIILTVLSTITTFPPSTEADIKSELKKNNLPDSFTKYQLDENTGYVSYDVVYAHQWIHFRPNPESELQPKLIDRSCTFRYYFNFKNAEEKNFVDAAFNKQMEDCKKLLISYQNFVAIGNEKPKDDRLIVV